MPSDTPIWYWKFIFTGQVNFSSWNLCRIRTFGTPIPCCPVDTLGEFWASERCSGSGKHAGRQSSDHIISECMNASQCENYHWKCHSKKRVTRVCWQKWRQLISQLADKHQGIDLYFQRGVNMKQQQGACSTVHAVATDWLLMKEGVKSLAAAKTGRADAAKKRNQKEKRGFQSE